MDGPLTFGFLRRKREPLPETWRFGDTDWPVVLARRPGSRRITLRLCAVSDTLRIVAPPRTALGEIRRIVDQHAAALETQARALPPRVAFADGAALPYLGRTLRIAQGSGLRNTWSETPDGPLLTVGGRPEHLPRRVRDALIRQAEAALKAAVDDAFDHAEAFNPRAVAAIRIGDTRGRWGSCASDGTLRFSWRIVFAPPEVLRYLAAHEVAHLAEMNHSPRFWAVVAAIDPHAKSSRAWLKTHGAALHRIGPPVRGKPVAAPSTDG